MNMDEFYKRLSETAPADNPPIPDQTLQAVYERAGGFCEECASGEWSDDELMMHYTETQRFVGGDVVDIYGHETPDDLIALCVDCLYAKHVHPYTDEFYESAQELGDQLAYMDHVAGKND
jgi:hypothetical protein